MAVTISPCDECQREVGCDKADIMEAMDYMIEKLEALCEKIGVPVEVYTMDEEEESLSNLKRSCTFKNKF